MEIQVNIGFEQLVQIVKKLPTKQWMQLKQQVDNDTSSKTTKNDLEAFLLSAPTFTEEQIEEIANTTKAINKWRTK